MGWNENITVFSTVFLCICMGNVRMCFLVGGRVVKQFFWIHSNGIYGIEVVNEFHTTVVPSHASTNPIIRANQHGNDFFGNRHNFSHKFETSTTNTIREKVFSNPRRAKIYRRGTEIARHDLRCATVVAAAAPAPPPPPTPAKQHMSLFFHNFETIQSGTGEHQKLEICSHYH
jgi:hypothetical protein